jgi:predicted DNA-binding protein
MARKKTYQNLYVGLVDRDQARLEALAKIDGKTKTELVREALLWYLDHRENEKFAERDSVYARAIKEMTNRICGMLARQGTAIGVLYDVAYAGLPDEESREAFREIVQKVKSRQRKHLDLDEQSLVAKMKDIVSGEVKAERQAE